MGTYFRNRNVFTYALGVLCLAAATVVAQPTDIATNKLQLLGEKVAGAVLSKNIPALLSYDRPDLRPQDEVWFKDEKSDLYCYVFGNECLPSGRRSVFEIFSKAKRLGVKVRDLGKSDTGERYALLLFYDRASIPDGSLQANDFLCKQAGKSIISWEFGLVHGTWEAVHPLFDAETDSPC
jgi:hypothetical protein